MKIICCTMVSCICLITCPKHLRSGENSTWIWLNSKRYCFGGIVCQALAITSATLVHVRMTLDVFLVHKTVSFLPFQRGMHDAMFLGAMKHATKWGLKTGTFVGIFMWVFSTDVYALHRELVSISMSCLINCITVCEVFMLNCVKHV